MSGGLKGKAAIRKFLLSRIGQIVTTEEVRDASGGQVQYSRRLRELRDEEGWPIESHRDVSDLVPGEYRLADVPPEKPPMRLQRNISGRLRAQVLERNGFTCASCGVSAGDIGANGRKAVMHVGHIQPKSEGGADELSNLRTLCSVCNQGAKDIVTLPPDRLWLLRQVRRANDEDQREVLSWLQNKFDR